MEMPAGMEEMLSQGMMPESGMMPETMPQMAPDSSDQIESGEVPPYPGYDGSGDTQSPEPMNSDGSYDSGQSDPSGTPNQPPPPGSP